MFKKISIVVFALVTILFSLFAEYGFAQGLIGGAIQGLGRATGIKPMEDLGRNADEEHRKIKQHNPDYRAVEVGVTEMVRRPFTLACTVPYQTITNAVIAQCSNWDGRLDDQYLIDNAKAILVNNGIFQASAFNGIQIRWCPLSGAHGMAPDRGRIYLDTSNKQDSTEDLAALLAHEMMHIVQYSRMGTDNFKCEYSRNYVDCGLCQNRNHPLEREAYTFEDEVNTRLDTSSEPLYSHPQYSQPQYSQPSYPATMTPAMVPVRFCQTQMGTCSIQPAMIPMGSRCFCNGPLGQVFGSAF